MNLFDWGKGYIKNMSIMDMGMLKICLFSIGVIVGILLPANVTSMALNIAIVIFAVTIILILYKMLKFAKNSK
jgi:ABC-type anion transport system duplicated permease subunit